MKYALVVLALVIVGFLLVRSSSLISSRPVPTPAPTDQPLSQLTPDQYPAVSLKFSSDGHYVTVNISNLHAHTLEYNLIYEAVVKKSRIQTGVNAVAKLEGKAEYSKQQLLGSESSGKFSYHQNINNAAMELVLRDASGRSVYTATYPFTHTPGKSLDLAPST